MAASLLPCVSANAPTDAKSSAVASCVVNCEPSAKVPVKTPFETVPVATDAPPDVVPPDVVVPIEPLPVPVDPVPLVVPPDVLPLDVPFEVVPLDVPPDVLPVDVDDVPLDGPPAVTPVVAFEVSDCMVPHDAFVPISICPLYRRSIGLWSAVVTPKARSAGPTARINTRRGIAPAMTKPTIDWLPFARVVRDDTFEIGAAPGISARLNRPVVVSPPDVVL
jgi:hypothetical protein